MTETKTTTKAAAKKAAPKPAAKKAAAPAGAKLRWQVEGDDRNAKGGKNQTARVGDRVYAIKKAGNGWKATVTVDGGKAETLSDTTFARAYGACVQHNRAAAHPAKETAA